MDEKSRKAGRPRNASASEPLSLKMPRYQYRFLKLLAKQGKLGASENDVALHILVRELDEMERRGYHDQEIQDD